MPPDRLTAFEKSAEKFTGWLAANGSAIHAPTNPYEVLRFDGPQCMCVVYRNDAGKLSWANGASEAWDCFQTHKPWRAAPRTERKSRRNHVLRSLIKRDGSRCCYCNEEMPEGAETVEHVVPITAGGPDHLANMTLACKPCNDEAGHMDARAKIEMAVRKRNLRDV